MAKKDQTPVYDASRDIVALQRRVAALEKNAKGSQLYQYNCTWGSFGTPPTLADGTLAAAYMRVGPLVWVNIHLTFGASTSPGTGAWTFTVPFAIDPNNHFFSGSCVVKDASAAWYTGNCQFWDVATSTLVAFTGQNVTGIGTGNPITWAVNDFAILSVVYATTA